MPPRQAAARWNSNANTILHSKIKSGHINPDESDPKILDSYNKNFFAEYCDLNDKTKIYSQRKRLCDKLRVWKVNQELANENRTDHAPPQDPDEYEEYEDEDEGEDPPATPPRSPSPDRPEPPTATETAAAEEELLSAFRSLSMIMALYNLDFRMVWLLSTTHWKDNGEKELVLDFIAPPFGISKFIFDMKPDGQHIMYSVKFPTGFFDVSKRDCHEGTEASMREACSQVMSRENGSHDGVESKKVTIGPLPFKCETVIKSMELIAELPPDDELYQYLAEAGVPEGAELQIPLVLRVVLVGQEKCHGVLRGRTMRVAPGSFRTPPRGGGGGGGPRGGVPTDPFAAMGGAEHFMNMMGAQIRRVAREEAEAARAFPAPPRSGGRGFGRSPGDETFRTASDGQPQPMEESSGSGGVPTGISVDTVNSDGDSIQNLRRSQRDRRNVTRVRSEEEDPTPNRTAQL